MSGCELQETDTGKRDNWDIRMDASWMARIHRWSRMKKFQRKRNHLIARKGWMSKKKRGRERVRDWTKEPEGVESAPASIARGWDVGKACLGPMGCTTEWRSATDGGDGKGCRSWLGGSGYILESERATAEYNTWGHLCLGYCMDLLLAPQDPILKVPESSWAWKKKRMIWGPTRWSFVVLQYRIRLIDVHEEWAQDQKESGRRKRQLTWHWLRRLWVWVWRGLLWGAGYVPLDVCA